MPRQKVLPRLPDLLQPVLQPFTQETQDLALWLRDFIRRRYPRTHELIYDNYNAVAIGWSLTERLGQTFSSIAVFRTNENVHLGFYRGMQLKDPKKLLLGKGNQYRYLLVKNKRDFPRDYAVELMQEAFVQALALAKNPALPREGTTVLKSVSPKKRSASAVGTAGHKKKKVAP